MSRPPLPPSHPAAKFSSARNYDQDEKSHLLSRKEAQGGFDWSGYDLSVARRLQATDEEFRKTINWLDYRVVPTTPMSAFNMSCENYVKAVILEQYGVLCQVRSVSLDSHDSIYWVMSGVCPIHRRVHRHQNWVINAGAGNDGKSAFIKCFHPSRAYGGRLPQSWIGSDLPLYKPGDGDNPDFYPVKIIKKY